MTPKQKKKKMLAKVMSFRKKLHRSKNMPGLFDFFKETGFINENGSPTELGRNALNQS